jgi:hypothetical protein
MKTESKRIIKRGLLFTPSVLLTAALLALLSPSSSSRASEQAANDRASFLSQTAQLSRAPGSPVGPPKKIVICHKKRGTISINPNAWPTHKRHGDYLGPCQ